MKHSPLLTLIMIFAAACGPATAPAPTPTVASALTNTPAPPTPAPTATLPPTATTVPTDTPAPIDFPLPAPQPYEGSLELASAKLPLSSCTQDSPFSLPSQGVVQLAFVPTGICANGEIGLFESRGRQYVVQEGGIVAAFEITDVTDPAKPKVIGAWKWRPTTFTTDVKPFRQGERRYLAMAMENGGNPAFPCGVALVEVTDPTGPKINSLYQLKTP